MNYRVLLTRRFHRNFKQLSKKYASLKSDVDRTVDEISEDPERGVQLSPNIYKIRLTIKSKGKGKSGGGRIIYMIVSKLSRDYLTLLTIYDKSRQVSVKSTELDVIVEEALQLVREEE